MLDRNQPGDTQDARALFDAALPVATAGSYGYIERDAQALLERIKELHHENPRSERNDVSR